MSVSRIVRAATVSALAGATALSFFGVSGAAAPAAHKPTPAPKAGTYASGEAKAITSSTEPSAYAVDRSGYEHFVQYRNVGGTGKIIYFSRRIGAKTWISHYAPGSFDLTGHPRLELTVDWPNNRLYVVAYTCSGVSAVELAPNAARLAGFTQVSPVSDCKASAGPVDLSASYYSGGYNGLHVIVPDATTKGQWDLMAGAPGNTFTAVSTLPTADSFVPQQLAAADYDGGVVVGQGTDASGDKAVFETSQRYFSDWSTLDNLGGLGSKTKDYVVESVSYTGRLIDVGLFQPLGSHPNQKYTLFMDEQDGTGQWTTPIPVPHTDIHDRNLILTTSPTTGKLRTTWERSNHSSAKAERTGSGIFTQRRVNNAWVQELHLSDWWRDTPLSVTYDRKGNPHVLYQQAG